MENKCIICGEEIPEGRMICPNCEGELIERAKTDFQTVGGIYNGVVVLTKQEHQKYCAYKIIEPQIKGCFDRERKLEKANTELQELNIKYYNEAKDLRRTLKEAQEFWKASYRTEQEARKETAREIYRELCGHGTTYVKKWIKKHYGIGDGE